MLITLGWATTLYHWRRKWLRQQQAWKWWHQQQAIQSHHTAESIRDGLLQQTFAFRRYLETIGEGKTTDSLATPDQTTRWLERFQTFYHFLETLSDELSPPSSPIASPSPYNSPSKIGNPPTRPPRTRPLPSQPLRSTSPRTGPKAHPIKTKSFYPSLQHYSLTCPKATAPSRQTSP